MISPDAYYEWLKNSPYQSDPSKNPKNPVDTQLGEGKNLVGTADQKNPLETGKNPFYTPETPSQDPFALPDWLNDDFLSNLFGFGGGWTVPSMMPTFDVESFARLLNDQLQSPYVGTLGGGSGYGTSLLESTYSSPYYNI